MLPSPLAVPRALWDVLIAAYGSPGRAYHNWTHIEEVVQRFHEVAAGPGWHHPQEVFLGLLLHDAVYEPGRTDNEARSAALATELVAHHLPGRDLDVALIVELINLTAEHGREPDDLSQDAALFLDCDMAILGAPPERFATYDRGVALEYQAVPPEQFRAGRRRFMSQLLARHRIFVSDHFRDALEGSARENLTRALEQAD